MRTPPVISVIGPEIKGREWLIIKKKTGGGPKKNHRKSETFLETSIGKLKMENWNPGTTFEKTETNFLNG